MKTILGSAQFGLNYGVTNTSGKVSEHEVTEILRFANDHSINIIDTAAAYGDSECVLGKLCSRIGHFEFISKLKIQADDQAANIEERVLQSCERLKVDRLYGLLIHDADFLDNKNFDQVWNQLQKLKKQGTINKVGVSVYSPEQALKIVDCCSVDIFQFPFNFLDQRFNTESFIGMCKKNKIELHARSLFLQGVILSNPNRLPKYFNGIKESLLSIRKLSDETGLSLMSMVRLFIKQHEFIDYSVFGVTSKNELIDIVSGCINNEDFDDEINWPDYSINDKKYLDPSVWRLHER
jgi:aryl-alcohol dehydrogenase-like predicted oxidoreductase